MVMFWGVFVSKGIVSCFIVSKGDFEVFFRFKNCFLKHFLYFKGDV